MADHSMRIVVGAKIDEFRTGMNAVAKELTAAEKAFKGFEVVGMRLQNIGKAFTIGVTLPIVAGFTAAGREFTGFEATMAQVQGLVGLSTEAVEGFKKEILALGPAVGKGPQELAEALYFITSAGIKGAAAMEVLEMSAKASAVGLGETKVVADLVTSAMNAYGAENLSAAKATDILVAAVREGKAEAPALAASMGQVLPIASEMQVSFDQVAAAIASMTRTGTNAETAAMQLKNVMVALVKPSTQANDALQEMGLSAAGLRQQIREEGLLAALMNIRETTNRFGEDAMAKVFPNIRALIGVLDLMGANVEENIEIFKRMTQTTGDLERAFGITQETAQFKLNAALSSLKTMLTLVGGTVMDTVIPVLEQLSKRLQAVTAWWNSLSDEARQFIVKAALVVAAVGPLIFILGTLFRSVKTIIDTVVLLKTALVGLWSLFGPMGLAIMGLIAVGTLLVRNWDTVKAAATTIWNGIQSVISSVVGTIGGIIDGVIGTIERAITWVQNLLGIASSSRQQAESEAAAAQAAAAAAQAATGAAMAEATAIGRGTTAPPATIHDIPRFQHGGIVPGAIGAPRLAVVEGGETILPTHKPGFAVASGPPEIHVHFSGPIYGMLDFEDRVKSVVRDAQRSGAFRGVIPAVG